MGGAPAFCYRLPHMPPPAIAPAVADAIDPARIRRVLVIKLRHHGDVLLASPVFSALKRAAPLAEIDAELNIVTDRILTMIGDLSK